MQQSLYFIDYSQNEILSCGKAVSSTGPFHLCYKYWGTYNGVASFETIRRRVYYRNKSFLGIATIHLLHLCYNEWRHLCYTVCRKYTKILSENQNKKSFASTMCTTNTVLDILKIFSFMLGFFHLDRND